MKKKLLVLMAVLIGFATVMSWYTITTPSDTLLATKPSATTAPLEPTKESVNPVATIVDPNTVKVKPLEVAATTAGSTISTTSWPYIPLAAGTTIFVMVALAALALRKRGHKFSWPHLLCSLLLVSLLTISVTPVYGEETFTVNTWDLGRPGLSIGRDSIDTSGNVWFGYPYLQGQLISYLNPTTNEVKTWALPRYPSYSITVSVDSFDNIWFIEGGSGSIGRLNPVTNFFTIWPVPTTQTYNAYTYPPPVISFDSDSNVYFSEVRANKIGRLNPNTNEVTEWVIPTSDSGPSYTMVDSTGNIWFAEYSGNKIAKLNPARNEITEWPIPTSNSRPSGLYVSKGQVYFVEEFGKIGRLNPNTNEVTEWLIRVYGPNRGVIVDSMDNVWSTDSGRRLVRLGSDNILTSWIFPGLYTIYYDIAIDTKVNLGDIYFAGFYPGASWKGVPPDSRIHRFKSAVT